MLKQNDSIRKLLGVTTYHDAGYTGKNTTAVILDGADGKPRKGTESYLKDVLGTATISGHASNVAQTIHEMSPNTRILYFNTTKNKDIIYEWVKAHKDEIDIINISMAAKAGMFADEYLRYESLGLPMICASGNDHYTDHISYPAGYNFTVSIGATNSKGTKVESYSNGGPMLNAVCTSQVNIMNEAGKIWAPDGTSFAAPTATGLLLLYITMRKVKNLPKLTQIETMYYVENNCVDMYEFGRDNRSGYGLFRLPLITPDTLIESEEIILPSPIHTVTKFWRCQTGAFTEKSNAKAKLLEIKNMGYIGYTPYIEPYFKVQLNAFIDQQRCRDFSAKLKSEGIDNFVIYY